MNLNLVNKRAVVCGSTQGIGKAVAMELANLGANVTLVARNEERLNEVLKSLPQAGHQNHNILVADFSDFSSFKSIIESYAGRTAEVHILVNNTGGPSPGRAVDGSAEEFTNAFSMHLLCYQVLVQLLYPKMKVAGFGRIINVISTSVKEPIKGLGVSNTIRAAVANWSKTLASELGPYGITVNNVLPGATDTQRLRNLIEKTAETLSKDKTEVEAEMKSIIPVGRFGLAKEIAAGVAFLATPAASYINGINLTIDGGRMQCL